MEAYRVFQSAIQHAVADRLLNICQSHRFGGVEVQNSTDQLRRAFTGRRARSNGLNKTHFQPLRIQCLNQPKADGCQAAFCVGWRDKNINHDQKSACMCLAQSCALHPSERPLPEAFPVH